MRQCELPLADGLPAGAPSEQPNLPPGKNAAKFELGRVGAEFWRAVTASPVQRTFGYLLFLGVAALFAGVVLPNDTLASRDYFCVLLLGSAIGVADVFGRYQEAPLRTLATHGALVRIGANAAASLLALWFIKAHPLTEEQQITNAFVQVFAAGFGALALFRLSLKVRIADQDLAIGPATLIDTILAAADRDASRSSAAATMRDAFRVQRLIGFSDILTRLAPLCVEVPQTLTDADRQSVLEQIKKCAERADCSEREKGTLVLARLARVVGWDVIEAAAAEIERANSDILSQGGIDPEVAALAREAPS